MSVLDEVRTITVYWSYKFNDKWGRENRAVQKSVFTPHRSRCRSKSALVPRIYYACTVICIKRLLLWPFFRRNEIFMYSFNFYRARTIRKGPSRQSRWSHLKADEILRRKKWLEKFQKNFREILSTQKSWKSINSIIFSEKSAAKLFTDGKWRLFRRNNVFTRHFYGRLLLDQIKKSVKRTALILCNPLA